MRIPLRAFLLAAILAVLMIGVVHAEDPGCYFGDGRINAHAHRDCAAPVQIFLTDNEILVLAYDASIANKPEQFIIRQPRNGTIRINEHDYMDYKLESIHNKIGIVLH